MKTRSSIHYLLGASLALGAALALAQSEQSTQSEQSEQSKQSRDFYQQHNLVSDGSVAADHADPNLVNAWGLAFNPFGFVWVANNHSGSSTLYDGAGVAQNLVVQIPTPSTDGGGNPTGIVFNGSSGFVVSKAGVSGPSRFLFATEDGVIAGWAPNVDGTHAVRAVDNSLSSGAIYKGLALSADGNGQKLYAADFFNGRVDVFDGSFASVTLPPGAFTDRRLPSGYAPFGIQAIGGDIYVTYAKQAPDKHDEVTGEGLGAVDVYTPSGRLLRRLALHGNLNAPWGMALAPAGFGRFANSILVGNFGDGRINAYDPIFGSRLGTLRGHDNHTIQIEGLWGIAFGNGIAGQSVDTLFFAAGPHDEEGGLYGRIDAAGDDNE